MNYNELIRAAAEADREAFLASDPDRTEYLGQIWDAAHRTMKDIARDADLTQRKLADHFNIPYRTMEDWCRGARKCPPYIMLMMQEILGLVQR